MSTADDTDGLKSLPESLETLLEEFDKAKEAFKTGYRLPFNDTDLNMTHSIRYRGLKAAITRFVCRQLPVVISLFYLFL
ncbi:hypothetical protein ACIXN2_12330 [Bacteroides fragilis]